MNLDRIKELIVLHQQLAIIDAETAELKIVEIPDDVSWDIDNYDGMEQVQESHRRWG